MNLSFDLFRDEKGGKRDDRAANPMLACGSPALIGIVSCFHFEILVEDVDKQVF